MRSSRRIEPIPYRDRPKGRFTRAEVAEVRWIQGEVRWIWNEFCAGTGLARRLPGDLTPTLVPPRLGKIVVHDQIRFGVEMRPGQTIEDFSALRGRLTAAFNADDAEFQRLTPGWIMVVLVHQRAAASRSAGSEILSGDPAAVQPTMRSKYRHPVLGYLTLRTLAQVFRWRR